MSLLNKASLIQIPSGYKDGTLYSAKPTNGDGDFTFSRGSNLAATRVNSEGLIEKGRENLVLHSNSFSSWSLNTGISETSGQSGYDGSSDAWQIDLTASTGRIQESNTTSGVQTFSVYAKAGTLNWVRLFISAGSNVSAFFNLSSGVVGTTSNVIDTNIEAVSGATGWYKCSITYNQTNASVRIYPAQADGDLTATSGNIIIQDAQLESGLVATDVITTTTTTEQAGILEDMPRLDYSGGASCPSLLLEPQRTNLIDYSEYFGAWIKSSISVGDNVSTSPEGVQNAATIDVVSDSSFASVARTISVSANSTHTMSLFVKKETSETNYMGLGFLYTGGTTDVGYVIIDSVNGTALSADPRIDVDTNVVDFGNYWRIEATATDSGSNTSLSVYIYGTLSINGTTVGVGAGSPRTIYGAMLEAGSYPTSYIPTYGGASVTRGQDDCNKTGISSLIGQTEGTFFAEIDSSQFLTGSYIGISDGGTTNRQIFGWEANSGDSGTLRLYGFWNGFAYSSFSKGEKIKIALAYKTNDFALYVNGTQAGTNTSASTSGTLSQFGFNSGGGAQKYQGNVYQALLFKTRLTNDELASLTTL